MLKNKYFSIIYLLYNDMIISLLIHMQYTYITYANYYCS